MEKLALLEVIDRDGRVRQVHAVTRWPLHVGRSLECDLVLDDPHVAPRHFSVEHSPETGVTVTVGETVNGLRCGHRLLAAGTREVRLGGGEEWVAGHTRLRLRLPDEMLAPELPLPQLSGWRAGGLLAVLVGLALWTTWGEYLDADPGDFLPRLAPVLIGVFALLALWCFLWALGSKIFQHRFDYWTHVRIASTGLLASGVLGAGLGVLAYSTSWVALSRIREPVEALVLATGRVRSSVRRAAAAAQGLRLGGERRGGRGPGRSGGLQVPQHRPLRRGALSGNPAATGPATGAGREP